MKGPRTARYVSVFIRFESPVRDSYSRVNAGIFYSAYHCLGATPRAEWTWAHAELRRELDWFCDRLEAPNELFYRPGRRSGRSGVCWFRDCATDHVSRARYMAWLLADFAYVIHVRRSEVPGAIIWEDTHQVVALAQSREIRCEADLVH